MRAMNTYECMSGNQSVNVLRVNVLHTKLFLFIYLFVLLKLFLLYF